jgi:hypothetical protein
MQIAHLIGYFMGIYKLNFIIFKFFSMMNSQLRDSNNLIGSRHAFMSLAMLFSPSALSLSLT